VKDEKVRELDPLRARHDLHEIALHLLGGLPPTQPQPVSETVDMGVHDDALGDAMAHAQHDIRRLSGDAREREQFLHRRGHPPAVRLNKSP